MQEIETPHGTARAHLHLVGSARAAMVLSHGAGGGVDAPDIVTVTQAAQELGVSVALIEQPYRVAGRRAPSPAKHLDASWEAVIEALRSEWMSDLPLIAGGRSMGSRVACRTAGSLDAAAVVCLAFPLQPAARSGKPPAPDRLHELDAVEVPTLVIQGERDPFGMPPERPGRTVARVAGDHGLKKDLAAVREAFVEWVGSRTF